MARKGAEKHGESGPEWRAIAVTVACLYEIVNLHRAGAQSYTAGQPSQQEVASLLAIKAAFGNPASLASWNDSRARACLMWVGIRCSDTGQVISLTLPGRGLTGPLTEDVGNLTGLRKISLHDNAITGAIPQSLGFLPAMRGVALFMNEFAGSIPSNLGNSSTLEALDLSFNQLSGVIPRGIGQSPRLYLLDFSFNFLWGGFPFALTKSQSLTDIVLAGNFLSGTLPDQWGNFDSNAYAAAPTVQLQSIDLQDNYFSGKIPRTFGTLGNLTLLHLGNNAMSGAIPKELTRLKLLVSIDFSNNSLTGRLPAEIARFSVMAFADLSGNSLTGGVPSGLGATNLSVLHLGDNSLSGGIPEELGNLTYLLTLNLSNNQLNGSVPLSVWELKDLKVLTLNRNRMTGNISEVIGNMTSLSSLDLSFNNFSGQLPLSLIGLTNLASLNVSYNNFSGPIPPFAYPFNNSGFVGNPKLCGHRPFPVCPAIVSPSPGVGGSPGSAPVGHGKKHHRFRSGTIVSVALGSALGALCIICLCLLHLWRKKTNKRGWFVRRGLEGVVELEKHGDGAVDSEDMGGKLVHFDGPMAFTADHLLCATAEVLGKSFYGTVYKATLEDGDIIAVKRLREGIVNVQKEFESEVGTLGKIRHPNLLALRAYYWGPKDEKLLVFDYMAGGSLAAFLHARGPETPLHWETRVRIAMGTARGLNYLHQTQNIIQGNLTASNILLDAQMNVRISDYGLFRLMNPQALQCLMASACTMGYKAPELDTTQKATAKSDVYSFGIVLLELLTGRAPVEQSVSETGMDLAEWVSSVMKEEWTSELFDMEIIKNADCQQEEDMYNTLQLAMVCVHSAPTARPEMEDVVKQLEGIRPELDIER